MLTGVAVPAHSQSAPTLKGSLAGEDTGVPVTSWKTETSLDAAGTDTVAAGPLIRRINAHTDPYAPTGIGTEGLRLYPSLTAGSIFSSNVNNSAHDPQSDIGLRLRPSLRVESDWSRHALTAGLDGDFVRYASHPAFDTSNLNIFERLRLDARRTTTADINSSYVLEEGDGTDPTEHILNGSLAVTQDFGPMKARAMVADTARFYDDRTRPNGTVEDNGDRDYNEPSLALRTTYNEYGPIRPYVEAAYSSRFHSRELDRHGINRDSTGLAVTAGVELDSGPIWSGDLGLTYLHRNYQSASLGSASVLGPTGSLTWSPTELTKIVMATGTSLDETTSAVTPATRDWIASIDMTYALRDNIDLLAGASLEIEDKGASTDKTYGGKLAVNWQFNPILAWTAAYDLTWLDAGTARAGYVEHRLSAGLTISR